MRVYTVILTVLKGRIPRGPSLRGVSKELLTDHVLRDAFLPCAPGAVEAHVGSPQAADSATGAVAAAASAAPVAQEVLTLDPAQPPHGAFGPGISGVPPPVVPRYTRYIRHGRGWYAYGVCSTVGMPRWGKLPYASGPHRTRRRLKRSRLKRVARTRTTEAPCVSMDRHQSRADCLVRSIETRPILQNIQSLWMCAIARL